LPLLLIMIGTVWFIINRVKTKKQLQWNIWWYMYIQFLNIAIYTGF
jgi:hypothetical protein